MYSVYEPENKKALFNLNLASPLIFKSNFMAKLVHSSDQLHSKFFSRVAKSKQKTSNS